MHCTGCGQKSEIQGAKFCRKCGSALYGRSVGAVAAVQPVDPAAPPVPQAPYGPPAPTHDARPLEVVLEHGQVFSTARVRLKSNQALRAESGAMVSMDPQILLEAKAEGGIWAGIKRMAAQESFMQSTFTAREPGDVVLAPDLPGDIKVVELNHTTLIIQGSSYLGGHTHLHLDTKFSGIKGIFAGESLFFLHVSGKGQVLIASYGAIMERVLAPGEKWIVDSGHIVAFDSTAVMSVRKASERGLWQTMMSGEGLVAEFTGPGRVFTQTRSFADLWRRIAPYVQRMNAGRR